MNNVAGLAGGGIALQDAVNVRIFHTTVAHNDSIATAGAAFSNGPNQSTPQPSGIVSRANSSLLTGAGTYSNPVVWNSIVWQNRSFYFGVIACPGLPLNPGDQNNARPAYRLFPAAAAADPSTRSPGIWDFGVLGVGGTFPISVATSLAGTTGANNARPRLLPATSTAIASRRSPHPTSSLIPVPAAFDEGGNFIRAMFGPLTLTRLDNGQPYGDYHVAPSRRRRTASRCSTDRSTSSPDATRPSPPCRCRCAPTRTGRFARRDRIYPTAAPIR